MNIHQIFIPILCLSLTACGISRTTTKETINRVTIERIDTTITIAPWSSKATFDSVTTKPQTREVPGGSVTIKKTVAGKIEVICQTDTIFVPVQMKRETVEEITKKDTITKSKGVRWRWFIFGIIAALVGRLVLRQLLI